jgi:hypothetical protein
MKNYLLKVEKVQKSLKHIFQDNLTQYQGSKGHSATSDVRVTQILSAISLEQYLLRITADLGL